MSNDFMRCSKKNIAKMAVKRAVSSQFAIDPSFYSGCRLKCSDMLGFMDYVQSAFYEASHWNRDNSYGTLNATAQGWYNLESKTLY